MKIINRKIISLAIITFALINASSVIAQNKLDKIDELLSYSNKNGIFNGNVLIAEKGKILYNKTFGFADLESQKPLSRNSSFYLASISKQMTAVGIMILKERNQLDYSDTINKFFPQLPKHLHSVTVRNLLNHTSGIPRNDYKFKDGLTNDDIFQSLMRNKSLLFEPDSKTQYSNTAYTALAMIVEKVSGKSFKNFLEENVFLPLGMTRTFVFEKGDFARNNLAVGYNGFGKKLPRTAFSYGAGGIYSTTEDLFRYSQALNTNKIISKQTFMEAIQPGTSKTGETLDFFIGGNTWGYGFGWFIYRDEFDGVVAHSGAAGGVYNILIKDRNHDREIIILSNNGRLFSIFGLSGAIQNILYQLPYELPKISVDLAIRKRSFDDANKGIRHYRKLKKEFPNKYNFESEGELNRLGYFLMRNNKKKNAIKILELRVSEFPKSFNAYDSLGEAYLEDKQYKKALKNYKKSLVLNNNNSNAEKMITKIKKQIGGK